MKKLIMELLCKMRGHKRIKNNEGITELKYRFTNSGVYKERYIQCKRCGYINSKGFKFCPGCSN